MKHVKYTLMRKSDDGGLQCKENTSLRCYIVKCYPQLHLSLLIITARSH